MGWLTNKIKRELRAMVERGELTPPAYVTCAACKGGGRTTGPLFQLREAEGYSSAELEKLFRLSQGICAACEGAGVLLPRCSVK